MDSEIKISDFSVTPGARYRNEGPFSAEEFRVDHLIPAFNKAREEGGKLVVDLDGTVGYGTSFLEGVFGGLAREYGSKLVLETLSFLSEEEDYLVDDIIGYITDAHEVESGESK